MPPHLISACAACAGDIRNARDRCEPIRGSRTVRRRAALSGSRTSEPADSVEKKKFSRCQKAHRIRSTACTPGAERASAAPGASGLRRKLRISCF